MHRREAIGALALPTAIAATAQPTASHTTNWQSVLDARLPLYGHRNWIVVADSAYPAQSRAGIETVVASDDYNTVLRTTLARINSARHVRPVIYQDGELNFVPESDAPGADASRQQIATILHGAPVTVLPHLEIIKRLDETAQTFNVLIIKTPLTVPYTSVFFQLDCAYWPADAEGRLRSHMSSR